MADNLDKSAIRGQLRKKLESMTDAERKAKSASAANHLVASPEFVAAHVVMLFLSTPHEIDTSLIALKAWQAGKTVVVPKVAWNQRRMLPVEISSLQTQMTVSGPGVREPVSGQPMPINLIDLVVVPGFGFTEDGSRIGRGMGFYDRFLAQPNFIGIACGLGFSDQIVPHLPILDHDMPLSMLCTDLGIRRFAVRESAGHPAQG